MSLRDVVVIGGGLSGLVAAHTLEQAGINYTIIEVKPRFGGSMGSQSQAGFTVDSGTMIHTLRDRDRFIAYLDGLGLNDAVDTDNDGVIFKGGASSLIDALTRRITAPRMMRMAVSTLGEMMGAQRFSICMENGMLLDTRALIVASPARYAERMFHTLTPDISYKLLDYQYDRIARVSLGYHRADAPVIATTLPDHSPIVAIQQTTHPDRVIKGGVLLQVAVRFDTEISSPDDIIAQITKHIGASSTPIMTHLSAWSESDPLMWQTPNHPQRLHDINQLLPQGVALIGNDYIPTHDAPCIDERIALAQKSAEQIIAWIG